MSENIRRNGTLAPMDTSAGSKSSSSLAPGGPTGALTVPTMAPLPPLSPGVATKSSTTASIFNTPMQTPSTKPKPRFAEENMAVTTTHGEGMQIFGIGKAGISRAVTIYTKEPKPEPLAVCFHFPNTFLSHAYVLHCVKELVKDIPEAGVRSLAFLDRNVMHGCTGLENRWIIRCRSKATKDTLILRGLVLCNKRILVRSYDDVIGDEFVEYENYKQHKTKLYGTFHAQLRRAGGNATGPLPALQDNKNQNGSGAADGQQENNDKPADRPTATGAAAGAAAAAAEPAKPQVSG